MSDFDLLSLEGVQGKMEVRRTVLWVFAWHGLSARLFAVCRA